MSLSEIIRNLTDENESLKQENDKIREMRSKDKEESQTESELHGIIQGHQKKARDMMEKIKELELKLSETKTDSLVLTDRPRYKALARKLKEERNMYRDMLDESNKKHNELKTEIGEMTTLIKDLRGQCEYLRNQIEIRRKETNDSGTQVNTDEDGGKTFVDSLIPPKYAYSSPPTQDKGTMNLKDLKDVSVQYEETEHETQECPLDIEKYSSCSSLPEDFKFVTPRFTDSALLVEEEQDRQEAIEEIQASLIGNCYRKHAIETLEMKYDGEENNCGSIPWTLVSKTFASKYNYNSNHNNQINDDEDVICTF